MNTTLGDRNNGLKKSLQNVYEFSNMRLEGALNMPYTGNFGKLGLKYRRENYHQNPIPDNINFGF